MWHSTVTVALSKAVSSEQCFRATKNGKPFELEHEQEESKEDKLNEKTN